MLFEYGRQVGIGYEVGSYGEVACDLAVHIPEAFSFGEAVNLRSGQ